jgi:transposase-like protein
MSQPSCSCQSFERLEGASVNAYINAFLDQVDPKNRYRCRVCGREWEKRAPEVKSEGTRPSLIKYLKQPLL